MRKINHIISTNQFTKKDLREIFRITDRMKQGRYRAPLKNDTPRPGRGISFFAKRVFPLRNKILATLFYEPSTRTRLSFESAMLKLGGEVISCENAKESSSAFKGENLKDSIKVISSYADAIVIRHPDNDSAKIAAKVSNVPIINAGNGTDEHPTQAILDLYTIFKKIGRLNKLRVALVGDLKNGRTVHSLINLMGKYDTYFYFVSPVQLKLSNDFTKNIQEKKIKYREEKLEKVITKIDILYMTRVQKERFKNLKQYQRINRNYILSPKLVQKMKKKSVILHPLPRIHELPEKIDNDPRAQYFSQAKNGLYVRMALLYKMLKS